MYRTLIAVHATALGLADRSGDLAAELFRRARAGRRAGGQSTAEYALVLLGAATVAGLFVAWATKTKRLSKLFDTVIDTIIGGL